MRTVPVLIALVLLAGCVNEQESVGELRDDERARGFSFAIPSDVRELSVELKASGRSTVDMRVELEREDRSDLAAQRYTLMDGRDERTLNANVTNETTAWVLVVARGGDVTVNVAVWGITETGERTLLRDETLVVSFAERQPIVTPTAS